MRDPLVCTKVIASTPNPQRVSWLAMHQDYSSVPVYKHKSKTLFADFSLYAEDLVDETYYGVRLVKHLLAGNRGHFGCLEHPQITVNACYYPHDVIVQARTHRIGTSFDCQSFRYTSESLLQVQTLDDLERVVYFRPVGEYSDRQGKKYTYSEENRKSDISRAQTQLSYYQTKVEQLGFSEEHARQMLPYSYRQHFLMSFNARSLMHFLDLRAKADAQLEIQWLADDLMNIFSTWMPEVAQWYKDNRWKKARLAP